MKRESFIDMVERALENWSSDIDKIVNIEHEYLTIKMFDGSEFKIVPEQTMKRSNTYINYCEDEEDNQQDIDENVCTFK